MPRPAVLYHASTDRTITEFEPRNESPRYEGEPRLVFATPHEEVAAMFLVPKTISAEMGKYDDVYAVFVNGTEEELDAQDKGGAIYSLPTDTFETDQTIGMGATEWVSAQPVTPLSKTVYSSVRDALRENNVRVYFLSNEMFERVQSNPSHGLELVQRP